MSNRVIVGQRIGRLGNQIYLLAHLLALHRATGIEFAHPTLGAYGRFFEGTANDPLARYPAPNTKNMLCFLPRAAAYYSTRIIDRTRLIDVLNRGNYLRVDYTQTVDMASSSFLETVRSHPNFWLFGGWLFRYPRITSSYFDEARRFFRLCQPFASHVEEIVAQARMGVEILFGVHIRQTDFKTHADGRYYFATGAYARMMSHCQKLFPGKKIGFLVVSDEKKSDADFPTLKCTFGTGVPIEDMYALGHTDYIISSYGSSFSSWPQFLFQKRGYRIQDGDRLPTLSDFSFTNLPWSLA